MTKKNKNCGSYTGYTDGCRCDECYAWQRNYKISYRTKLKSHNGESRLPIKDLLDIFDDGLSAGQIAERIGIPRGTVSKWLSGRTKVLERHAADKYATKLGMHPSEIWGDAWWRIPIKEDSVLNSIEMMELEDELTQNV